MARFAEGTEVSVEKSRAEIEKLITRYGATSTAFVNALRPRHDHVRGPATRRIVFELLLPDIADRKFDLDGRRNLRTPERRRDVWEQACRQRWRALALVIKAKLEAVASGITTFEDEFLAHIMMPDGQTVGAHVKPSIESWYTGGSMQPLSPAPTKPQ